MTSYAKDPAARRHFPTQTELQNGLVDLHNESHGLLSVQAVQPKDLADLADRMAAGDPEATKVWNCAQRVISMVHNAPRRTPALCATCPQPIDRTVPFLIGVVLPGRDDATKALGMALCGHCVPPGDVPRLRAKLTEAVRAIWPNSRTISISNARGHA